MRILLTVSAAAFAALFAAAAPVYGPDYGPTDFSLPGAFATTNYYPVPVVGTVRYVAPDVPTGSGDGTSFASPWNLYEALNGWKAQDGTILILSGGVYRVANYTASGLSIRRPITIQPYLDQKVWLKGSTQLVKQAFSQVTGQNLWRVSWSLCFTNILNVADRDNYISETVNPIADDGGMVFDRTGQPLRQVPTLAEVGPGRFYIDYGAKQLYVGDDPADICPVEATACTNGLEVIVSNTKRVTFRGLGISHFANVGIQIFFASSIVENCVSVWNGNNGLRLLYTHGSEIRGCTLSCNGQNGGSVLGSHSVSFENNDIAYNNVESFATWRAAGLKICSLGCTNMVFRGNVFERNYAEGLWLDENVYGALVVDNVARFNTRRGLFVEISHSNSVAFNTVYGNNYGILILDAPHNRVYNNTVVDNVSDGVRIEQWNRTNVGESPEDAAALALGNTWHSYSNHVANNLLCGKPSSGGALFGAKETYWPGQSSFRDKDAMVTLSKNNLYNCPDSTVALISARADLTVAVTNYTDLAQFRQHYPGFESGSAAYQGADPFFRDAAARDYRPRTGGAAVGRGTVLPADLAILCGRPAAVGYAGALAPWDEGWWRFDEASGLALDCVSTNNGTLAGTGSPPLPQRLPGKGRYALSFKGTNYVRFTTPLSHLNGALTVSAWVKPDSPPTGGRIIANTFQWDASGHGQSRGWLLGNGSGTSDEISFKVWSPAGASASTTSSGFFKTWSNRWAPLWGRNSTLGCAEKVRRQAA